MFFLLCRTGAICRLKGIKEFARFVGRFNEKASVAWLGSVSSLWCHGDQSLDAIEDPATTTNQICDIGIWFGSPDDSVKADCLLHNDSGKSRLRLGFKFSILLVFQIIRACRRLCSYWLWLSKIRNWTSATCQCQKQCSFAWSVYSLYKVKYK